MRLTTSPSRATKSRFSGRLRLVAVALAATLPAVLLLEGPAVSTSAAPAAPIAVDDLLSPFLGAPSSLGDVDRRAGSLTPTAAQRQAVTAMGAAARWNKFGTPQSLIKSGDFLAVGLSADPATAARSWLRSNAGLFKLSLSQINGLQLLNTQRMAQSTGRAVLFRQRFGGLPSAVDGLLTVGVSQGRIAYVSSSIAPTSANLQSATISATQAWRNAAADVGRPVAAGAIGAMTLNAQGWLTFPVTGFAQAAMVRARALPAPDGTVRRVFEVNLVDSDAGSAFAFTSYVDASTGAILVRRDQVDHSEFTEQFTGAVTATDCGPLHPYTVDAATKTIVAAASTAVATNDIVLNLIFNGTTVASSDTATSPEAVTYSPGAGVPAGVYNVQVCPFADPTVAFTAPGDYVGVFSATEQGVQATAYPPKWKYFLASPALNYTASTIDSRKTGCWVDSVGGADVPGCDNPPGPLLNLAARGPWDYDFRTNTPTMTTAGNAAITAEAWSSPLTPGAIGQRPVSPTRSYPGDESLPINAFADIWNNSRCDPTTLTPGGNDILPAVTDLFATHNRLHDWSYFLGFTELNYNLQDNNFGNRAEGILPTAGEADPEVGQVQAGAITGGAPSYLGRDNANQITLQDGVPGITNQYLFQPIAGAFYSPCVDGDFDVTIVGHEYNHAISNRMVGGPDNGLTSFQGGSMGESWGDQVALEYLFEHSYPLGVPGAVEGPYATGNKKTGIRNYALDNNPLQYGDLGYDVTGPEVHADGEPWSAVMWAVRQGLINKYNADFPVTNKALQRRCSQGDSSNTDPRTPLPADRCPGNRRWAQLLIDSYLLQQSGTSMLDARDAMLSADMLRFGGANQALISRIFASRGFGSGATTVDGEDNEPKPDYTSDSPSVIEGTFDISATEYTSGGRGGPVSGTLYVGDYEARVTPIADTDPSTALPNTVSMVPGNYRFVFSANGFGLSRFTQQINAGQPASKNIHLSQNLASSSNGAVVDGQSDGANAASLIDDTEATNWAGINPVGVSVDTPAAHPFVNIDLAGSAPTTVRSVKVSAMLRPVTDAADADQESGSRFTALRDFAIATCTESVTSDCSSVLPADVTGSPYTTIYDSTVGKAVGAAAFDSTLPRPLAPDLLFKTFDVPDTAATHVRFIALENQCSGVPEYAGEQDNDPLNATDCKTASDRDESVRAAEVEIFPFDTSVRPPEDPFVAATMTGPATAAPGSTLSYTYSFTNLGPKPSSDAVVEATLPVGVSVLSANRGGVISGRTITWPVGTVAVNQTGSVIFRIKVSPTATAGTIILSQAQLSAPLTFSPPAATLTTVVP